MNRTHVHHDVSVTTRMQCLRGTFVPEVLEVDDFQNLGPP